jgi:hypothetical protein
MDLRRIQNIPLDICLHIFIHIGKDYLSFNQPLEKIATTYRLDFPEDKTMSLNRFLELFYFARRRNFGKATVDRVGVENVKGTRRGAGAAKAQGSFSVKKKQLVA